ncbi:MAG: HK97 family phage prohead protease, partial [Pseudomonadota bacterium]
MELKSYIGGVKEMNQGEGVAVFATLNVVDKDGDVTLPGAFGEQHISLLPAHKWDSVPLGKGVTSEVGDEARVALKFNLDNSVAKDWYSALKFDLDNGQPIQEWSYGFDVLEAEPGEFQGKSVRFLKRMKVMEASPVLVGAGENTRTLALKSSSMTLEDQLDAAIADVTAVAERVAEVKDLRQLKGKVLSVAR